MIKQSEFRDWKEELSDEDVVANYLEVSESRTRDFHGDHYDTDYAIANRDVVCKYCMRQQGS
jgi:hypothetical protein